MQKGDTGYKPGGLHTLACLYFLSMHINEKRSSITFFREFARQLSPFSEKKLGSSLDRTFNDVMRYMSGSSLSVKFPHDTWADVVTNNTGQQTVFLNDVEDIRDRLGRTAIFEEVKKTSSKEAWNRVLADFNDNPNTYIDEFLVMAETLLRNYSIDELESYDWFDVEFVRRKSSQYSNIALAKNINNILEVSQSRLTNIVIKDSVVNRSKIGGDGGRTNIEAEDSVINRSN